MTWTNLLANKEAQKHKTSKKELDNMRALIARDLRDASLAGLRADRRFATAYNAALQARKNSRDLALGYIRPSASFTSVNRAWLIGVDTPSSAPRRAM